MCGSSFPKIADKGIMVTVEIKRNIMSCQEVANNIHPSANEVLLHKRTKHAIKPSAYTNTLPFQLTPKKCSFQYTTKIFQGPFSGGPMVFGCFLDVCCSMCCSHVTLVAPLAGQDG